MLMFQGTVVLVNSGLMKRYRETERMPVQQMTLNYLIHMCMYEGGERE